MNGMLEVINLSHTHAKGTPMEKAALKNVSFRLQPGEFACVVGQNGSGKSSLLHLIAGVYRPDQGIIKIKGEEVTALPQHRRAGQIGLVWQNPLQGTAPGMTVEENLTLALCKGRTSSLQPLLSSRRRNELREHLSRLDLGLEDRLRHQVGLLSGGQRQALTLLMATVARPRLLLLDEHTAALDPAAAVRVIDITKRLIGENQLTTLMVTHNLEQAVQLGNRLLMLTDGELVMDRSAASKAQLDVQQLEAAFHRPTFAG